MMAETQASEQKEYNIAGNVKCDKWMLALFPLITLTLFLLGITLLWAINTYVVPIIG